jgi:hypothetical protein
VSNLRKKISKPLSLGNNSVLWVLLGLGLVLLMNACGDPTVTVNPAITLAATTPAAAITGPDLTAIVQPKVIRTASDSYRKTIQFTEQPATLNDGIPSLLWFDAEG